MITCAHCGRQNDDGSRFCMDCGKPLSASAIANPGAGAAAVPATRVYAPEGAGDAKCPACGRVVDGSQPFCAFCGAKLGEERVTGAAACPSCGAAVPDPGYKFCPSCAAPLAAGAQPAAREGTAVFSPRATASKPPPAATQAPPISLVVVSEDGTKGARYALTGEETTIGRSGADLTFADDVYLSPSHAVFIWKAGKLSVRDLGSRNGTWIFLEGPHRLVDGDLVLIGSQMLRFRRLGYPGPHPPEADATRRMGSLVPSADIASLAQLRADGSVRDVFHLSPGRDIALGRDKGDWSFPYDPSMSGAHAIVRSEDADFVLQDAGSRNGVALAVRGDAALKKDSKILVGDKLLMVEMA